MSLRFTHVLSLLSDIIGVDLRRVQMRAVSHFSSCSSLIIVCNKRYFFKGVNKNEQFRLLARSAPCYLCSSSMINKFQEEANVYSEVLYQLGTSLGMTAWKLLQQFCKVALKVASQIHYIREEIFLLILILRLLETSSSCIAKRERSLHYLHAFIYFLRFFYFYLLALI